MLKYQQGEYRAMDELLRRYKNPVYRFVFRLSLNMAEAQDITQEVFLRVHKNRMSYQPSGKFSTWIFSIAHNVFISRWRRQRRFLPWPTKNKDSEELAEFASPDPSPDETVYTDELSGIVRDCVKTLPLLQREALFLREFEKLDYDEIARILKKSLGTVKTLIHRARLNLKEKLLPFIKETGGCNV
ncbi:MAG TPA: RNA polymerase sigma factor [Candidatus Omnitrophota bacterium]|nr:RNA polymerase sigma factor [Candidatus Omnitrophota bacterium]